MTTHWLVPHRSPRSILPSRRSAWPLGGFGGFDELDRLFADVWRGFAIAPDNPSDFAPRVDIRETDEEYRVTAELPGLEEKDFEVTLDGDTLTIKGEKRVEGEEKGEGSTHVETSRGSFSRSFQLPIEVDPDAVKAAYKNGVLTLTLPKPPEAESGARTIPVASS